MDGWRETNKRWEKMRVSLCQPGAERTRGGNVTSPGAEVDGGTASRVGLEERNSKACRGLTEDVRRQDMRSCPSRSSVGLAWVRTPGEPAGSTGARSAVHTGQPQTQSRPENSDREGLWTWASLPFLWTPWENSWIYQLRLWACEFPSWPRHWVHLHSRLYKEAPRSTRIVLYLKMDLVEWWLYGMLCVSQNAW